MVRDVEHIGPSTARPEQRRRQVAEDHLSGPDERDRSEPDETVPGPHIEHDIPLLDFGVRQDSIPDRSEMIEEPLLLCLVPSVAAFEHPRGPLVPLGIVVLLRIPREEALLIETFGDQYRAYMARTKRLIPGIW